MKKQNVFISLIKSVSLALIAFLFDLKWEASLQDKNGILTIVFFLLMCLSILLMLLQSGFRFRFVTEKIKKERVNISALIFYPFAIYLLLKNGILEQVFNFSRVMGIFYLLLIILVIVAPLYMDSKVAKSNESDS